MTDADKIAAVTAKLVDEDAYEARRTSQNGWAVFYRLSGIQVTTPVNEQQDAEARAKQYSDANRRARS